MGRAICVLSLLALLTACGTTNDTTDIKNPNLAMMPNLERCKELIGQGSIRLSPKVKAMYRQYHDGIGLFAVTWDGLGYGFGSRGLVINKSGCVRAQAERALAMCERHNRGRTCKIYAIAGRVVWENPGKQGLITFKRLPRLSMTYRESGPKLTGSIDFASISDEGGHPIELFSSRFWGSCEGSALPSGDLDWSISFNCLETDLSGQGSFRKVEDRVYTGSGKDQLGRTFDISIKGTCAPIHGATSDICRDYSER